MHERPFFFPTLYVRKNGKCHRGAWKACWQIPNVTRPELKVRGRLIFIPTLHVRKTGSGENGDWMRKMEICGGKRGPERLQRVSEAAGKARGSEGHESSESRRAGVLTSRREGRRAGVGDRKAGRTAGRTAVSLSSRSGCRSAVGGCGGRGVGVACSRRSFGEAFRRSRTSIRIGGLQIRGS